MKECCAKHLRLAYWSPYKWTKCKTCEQLFWWDIILQKWVPENK